MSEDIREAIARLNDQVVQLYQQGQYNEALEHALEALDLVRQHLDEEDPTFFTTLFNLASLYYAVGNYELAEPLFQQVLALQRQLLGEQHPDVTTTMNNLASLYYMSGDYEQAESLYQQVLKIRRTTLGEQHPDVATSLNNLAAVYYSIGNYEQAEQLYQRALAIQRAAFGDEHPHVAISLNNLAALYESEGDYEQATSCYQQALEIQRVALGEQHPDVAKILNNLAELSYSLGDYEQAGSLYQQALTTQRSVWGEMHPDVAKTLGNLAVLYMATGDYEQAEQLHTQALEIRRKLLGEEHPDVATSLDSLSVLYRDLGNYRKAEALCQQALEIRRNVQGEDHPDTAKSLYKLGTVYYFIGDYEQAKSLYLQALEIQRTVLDEQHPDVARSLNGLAVLYRESGDYEQAESLYQQALKIQRTVLGEQHPDVATSLSNLAVLYREVGDYKQAESLYHQALAIERAVLGEQHPDVATSLNNLALLYYVQGNYEQAESLYQQALAIRRMVLGERHPDVAGCLNNLAMLSYAMEKFEQAVQQAGQALEIQRAVQGEQHPDVAASLGNLAVLHYALGEYEQAISFCRQGLELQRAALGEYHPDVGGSLYNLAVFCAAVGQQAEALGLMREAAVIDDHMVEHIFAMSSDRQRLAYLATLQGDLDAFLSLVLHRFSTSPEAVQAVVDLVLRRKAVTVEALAVQQEAILSGRYPHLTSKFRALTTLRMQITQKELAGPGLEDSHSYQHQLEEWNAQKERLEADLARHIPEMRAQRKHQNVTHQVVAEALPPGSALIEFVHFDVFHFQAVPAHGDSAWMPARYVAFVLLADDPDYVQLLDLGEADQIDGMLTAFRMAITGELDWTIPSLPINSETLPEEEKTYSRRHLQPVAIEPTTSMYIGQGVALRKALFDPLVTALRGHTRLFLAPDGDLTRLPFEILPTDDGSHLIDTYQINYLGTGRDVLRFASSSSRQPSPPLVFADPDFDLRSESLSTPSIIRKPPEQQSSDPDRSHLRFRRLSGTRAEGEQVATLLGVEPLLAEAALETRVKATRSPRLLHIATHGFFLPDQPQGPNKKGPGLTTSSKLESFLQRHVENQLLRSGLALAGANTWNRGEPLPAEAEDGLLTAEDVSGLDLLDTELVVLSACETGLGEVHIGEGVFGLRRAFVLAGAKTLVMSLWKIPDQQTQELMAEFYRHMLSGLQYADALRAGQLAMKSRYAHPYYWGAFICQGTPGAGTSEHSAR